MSEEEKKAEAKTEQLDEKKTETKSKAKKPENKEEKTETGEEKTEETKPVVKEEPKKELPKFEKSIADKLENKFGQKTAIEFVKPTRIRVKVAKEDILDIARYIRDELHFDHAESVSGVDYPDQKEIEVVYHLGSYTDPELEKQVLSLATRAPREDNPNPGQDSTRLPSLRDIFYSVEFHERECFEMLGVFFEGHPDNRRLLLPEDWADLPPLRKDFKIKGR